LTCCRCCCCCCCCCLAPPALPFLAPFASACLIALGPVGGGPDLMFTCEGSTRERPEASLAVRFCAAFPAGVEPGALMRAASEPAGGLFLVPCRSCVHSPTFPIE